VQIPTWLTFLIAACVLAFGGYRLRLGLYSAQRYAELRERSPMYRVSRRTHLLMGIFLLGMGGWLVLNGLGVQLGP
jgi:hypothetical protein